jgi:hypothetical protein
MKMIIYQIDKISYGECTWNEWEKYLKENRNVVSYFDSYDNEFDNEWVRTFWNEHRRGYFPMDEWLNGRLEVKNNNCIKSFNRKH